MQPTPDEAPRPSLLDAALRLASIWGSGDQSFAATAARIASYDMQPHPVAVAFMSNHVVDFLLALDAARRAREDGEAVLEAQAPTRPTYGPRLREV